MYQLRFLWILCVLLLPAHAAAESSSLFEEVVERAREMAVSPYRNDDPPKLPRALHGLDYEAYRDIRFRKSHALWADSAGFNVEFFHPGFLYRWPVSVHEVSNGAVRTVPFSADMFDYGRHEMAADDLPEDLGFAGFRLHYPVHDPDYADELMVFLGASYFRMVGRGQSYGLSLRGLAVDTALPSGEEFPRFTEFWLVRPDENSNRMEILALLDSASVTGAYAFEVESRRDTVVTVDARLFARKDVRRLGIAPLTSMYAWGTTTGAGTVDDYRPKVHDSDGLTQLTGAGEWIWRPLSNPPALRVTSLADSEPQGFGLAQRDRRFESYQDPEARYDQRPGVRVVPLDGDWGRGAVQLVEIPTPDETHDNIVAYWVSDEPFRAGQARSYRYRLSTFGDSDNLDGFAMVTDTRQGWAWVPGSPDPPPREIRRFVVDFEGGELAGLAPGQPVEAELSVKGGQADKITVKRLPNGDVWRAAFELTPTDTQRVVDMRLLLTLRGRRLSETWSFLWDPATVASP